MKHQPFRTCLGCRSRRPKGSLIRLVRDPGGVVRMDVRARRGGRGAYVCAERSCIDRGLQASRLSHALRRPCVPGAALSAEILAVGVPRR